MKAYLVLEDGSVYKGQSFGACGEAFGELVFNTLYRIPGILTDPSIRAR
jgi:carbamoyl-phosphate synthase small subunit